MSNPKSKANTIKKTAEAICVQCNIKKISSKFYSSYNKIHNNGIIPYCKDCISKNIRNVSGSIDISKVKDMLQLMDKPFLYDLWGTTVNATQIKKQDVFGIYMKNIQMPQTRYLTWKDSIFLPAMEKKNEVNYDIEFTLNNEIILKWGNGYQLEEYQAFERKYEFLKNNYPEKTAMHTEALLKYIRYSVKEEMATASNDIGSAKEWGRLAKDSATAAKINPSQLSAIDLTDGLNAFGQLSKAVEQVQDIIGILPKFKQEPYDMPDFNMFCYINYIRDMQGLPLCAYEDIWKFYDERKKEYSNRLDFLKDDDSEKNRKSVEQFISTMPQVSPIEDNEEECESDGIL